MSAVIPPKELMALKDQGFIRSGATGLFTAHVIAVAGVLSADETAALADAARRFGDGRLILTPRLTAEITGIPYENLPAFTDAIARAGLFTGGAGHGVRPVVCCKGSVCPRGLTDTFALARELHERFTLGYRGVRLPHKFNIAVGGCPNNCAKADLNDVGIVCFRGFRITLGGHWGRTGAAGVPMTAVFPRKEEVFPVVEKAILLYKDQGAPGERFYKLLERLGMEQAEALLLSDELLARKDEILSRP